MPGIGGLPGRMKCLPAWIGLNSAAAGISGPEYNFFEQFAWEAAGRQ